MREIQFYGLLLIGGLLMFGGLTACKKDKDPENPTKWSLKESVKGYAREEVSDTIVLNSNAIMIGDDINDNLLEIGDDVLKFKNSSALDIMLVGDVIYSLPTDKHPDGYAFVITSKEVEGSQVICSYQQATIEDVFEKLDQKLEFKPDMSENGIKLYDVMGNAGGGRMSASGELGNTIGFNTDKIKSVKFTENSAGLTYVLYDIDGDYKKTENDQITAEVKLSADFNKIGRVTFDGLNFKFSGEPVVGASVELHIGKVKGDLKINNTLAGVMKKELVGKRIPLLTFNVAQLSGVGSALSIVVAPTVDIFMTLEMDMKGNLTAKLSYENTKLNFSVQRSIILGINRYDFKVQEWGKPDFSIEAKLEGEAKLGLGTGLTFRLPAFKYDKKKMSYIGLYTDLSYIGNITGHGEWSVNDGAQCKTLGFSLKPRWQTQIDGKLGIFTAGVLDIKVQPEIFDIEVGFLRKLEKNFNYCEVIQDMNDGQIYDASEFPNPYLNQSLKYGKVTDIDGNVYPTIKIGTQTWMAENLKTTRYNDGTAIPNVTDRTQWENLTTGAWCYYDNNASYNSTYGKLYNGYAVNTGKLCPKGWHIPNDDEWRSLENYLGSNTGNKMKSTGNTTDGTGLWWKYTEDSTEGTNESGFTGLPSGFRYSTFSEIGKVGNWWHSTEFDTYNAYYMYMYYHTGNVLINLSGKVAGFSCRCLRD